MMNNKKRFFIYFSWWIITILFFIGILYGALYLYIYKSVTLPILALIIIYALSTLVGVIIFASNRESYSKLSWFILVILLPILGAAFFLIFGSRFKRRMSSDEYHKQYVDEDIKSQTKNLKNIGSFQKMMLSQISNIVKHPIAPADIEIMDCGGTSIHEIFKGLRRAKKFIHAHYYIFKQGEIFEEFKTILIEKAKQGVEVRIIVDDFGRWALPWYEIKSLKDANVYVAIWGKVTFPFISGENVYRTHRKMIIIDGKELFTGGANIANEYGHLSKKFGYWYDIQMKITGATVRSYALLFINDWKFMSHQNLSIDKYAPIIGGSGSSYAVMVESGPDNIQSHSVDVLIKLVLSAKKTIFLTTPYFIPDNGIMSALRIAASSGVDIKIIIPGITDKKNVRLATSYFATQAQIFGVKFYTINDAFMHSKCGIFDNEIAFSGTVNLDVRSFYQQFEVISIMTGKVVDEFSSLFEKYLKYSTKKIFPLPKNGKFFHKVYTIIVRIFAPLM